MKLRANLVDWEVKHIWVPLTETDKNIASKKGLF